MAKTKKVQSTKGDEGNDQDVNGGKGKKLSKNLKGRFTSRFANPPTGEMVIAALKALKNERGVAMATICKYLLENFGGFGAKIAKKRREEIKSFIRKEFDEGNIVMANADEDEGDEAAAINFTKRFNYVEK